MEQKRLQCDHECRFDCTLLTEALKRESELGHFYEQLLDECDYPDVRAFVSELAEKRRESINTMVAKLNRMYSSFDPSGV
ncbi:MAG TPA: hypothetical protein VII11_12185 [Bacteroidota bacterium]